MSTIKITYKKTNAVEGEEYIFVKAAQSAPANTRLWPKDEKAGYSMVFMPYGPKGRGFYLKKD
jgi:hypothetical protein